MKVHVCMYLSSMLSSDLLVLNIIQAILTFLKLFQKLQVQLEVIKSFSVDSKEDEERNVSNNKKALSDFVKNTMKSRIEPDSIRKVLAKVYSNDLLVDNSVYEWALGEIALMEEVCGKPLEEVPTKEEIPSLFSEDTVYHACLCSLATSTCTVANYKDFFNKKFPGHSLEEASLSRSQDREAVDRYLIARQGKVSMLLSRVSPCSQTGGGNSHLLNKVSTF